MFKPVRPIWKIKSLYSYSTTHFQVFHDHKLKEFSLGKEEGEKAFLQYKEIEPSVICLEHTVVPEKFQGQGLGKLLAEAALEYALDKNLKVKVDCDFVKKFLRKSEKPEFKRILID